MPVTSSPIPQDGGHLSPQQRREIVQALREAEAVAAPPQKILVTGAAGFIASRVCALLHGGGREVAGLDNFNDAYDVRLKDWRWAQLEKLGGLDLHRLDLTDTAGV